MRDLNLLLLFFLWAVRFVVAGSPGVDIELKDFKDFNLDIDQPINVEVTKKQYHSNDGITFDSNNLEEFTPIRNTISQSEMQYYSFNVNTSSGVGQFYQFLIFLTGNICSQPDSITNYTDNSLVVYYSFNSSMFSNLELGNMILYADGYFEALTDVPRSSSSTETILYIAVQAPENTNKSVTWTYEIGVSQNDLVFQWDDRSWASLVDADDDSALIVTGNLTDNFVSNISQLNTSDSRYSLYLYSYDYKDYFNTTSRSWCAVRNGPALLTTSNFETSYTQRGSGLKQQFFIPGLNESTKYIAYLVSSFGGSNYGGSVYQPFEFETMDTGACELLFDLEFCDQVAYAVPVSSSYQVDNNKTELMQLYDDYAQNLYANFSKALQQIACDTESDAIYSPLRTCTDCASSYKDWLCSVSIPRCTTRNQTGFKHRDIDASRNDYINTVVLPPDPYFEILPCVNVCHAIVRDCPSDFGFLCPTEKSAIELSYYWDVSSDYASCNFVGSTPLISFGHKVFLNGFNLWFGVFLIIVFLV